MFMKKYLYGFLVFFFLNTACDSYEMGGFIDEEREIVNYPPDTDGIPPSELFKGLLNLFEDLDNLTAAEIDGLTHEQLWDLSEPLLKLWKDTIELSNTTLNRVHEPLEELFNLSLSWQLDAENHLELNDEIKTVLTSNRYTVRRNIEEWLDEVRVLLADWKQDRSKEAVCNTLFNRAGEAVLLLPGDNFDAANFFCPDKTLFYITEGVYSGQTVYNPKAGSHWIGAGSEASVLDGNKSTEYAFLGRMNQNSYHFFQIRNYEWFGINSIDRSGNGDVEISHISFNNIGEGLNGEEYGAVKVEWMKNLLVRNSVFENVTSAVRFVNSEGPLQVIRNRALNPGRNFFQCDKCVGEGIRINYNTMQHTEKFGTNALEDYISIFKSEGTPDDWIQVNYNRARGHGGSLSGSFMILADAGGKFQEAVGNVGVNPGQVGIGVASGENIRVEGNLMYSEPWSGSNVAYYSADFDPPCGNHLFPGPRSSNPNRANWLSALGAPNRAWTNGKCGVTNIALRDSILESPDIGPEIWNLLP